MKTQRIQKIKRWQHETINLTYQKIQEMTQQIQKGCEMTRIKLWLLDVVFNWCMPELSRSIEYGILEDFYMELRAMRVFYKKDK